MRILLLISAIIIISCGSNNENHNSRTQADTITVKIGGQHLEPTPTKDLAISIRNINGERLTRFYSDSTYRLTIEHALNISLSVYERTNNFKIQSTDSTFLLTTNKLDSGQTDKLQLGFLSDTLTNILIYHYRTLNNDSTRVNDHKKRIDSVGYVEFKLYGRNSL